MLVGLGEESVLETAIALHHTYGIPYIPGSALKGLAARYANKWLASETWGKGADAYTTVFGAAAEAGYITFFDALYIPGSADGDRPLALDVVAVHHRDYYSGADPAPPADWDSPVPIPLLSATGAYLVALHGAESWVEAAFEILNLAFAEEGVGAKTSSGYGRMSFEPENGATTAVDADRSQQTPKLDQPRRPEDLSPGQVLQGRVVNIVNFGAFVDIGVGRDGLVHISELGEGYVNDVSTVVSEGQVVRVKVLSVERRDNWRIGLTMKVD
jgi:CRISPR-associated protein Cmr6